MTRHPVLVTLYADDQIDVCYYPDGGIAAFGGSYAFLDVHTPAATLIWRGVHTAAAADQLRRLADRIDSEISAAALPQGRLADGAAGAPPPAAPTPPNGNQPGPPPGAAGNRGAGPPPGPAPHPPREAAT